MKVGITCGGIGPYGTADFLRLSAQAAERVGFTHYVMPEHIVAFAEYPESIYPYAGGSGQEIPEQDPDAPLQFADDTYANVNPRNPHVDTVVAMTWIAAATKTIEVGTNVMVLPQRNPVILAKALATLDSFSGGRLLLGVGAGWCKEEFDAVGANFSVRGKRTNESIDALRALWDGDTSTYSGQFFSFKDAFSFPKPARKIPVLIGGESKAAMQRVARQGDGWFPYNLPVDEAAAAIADLKAMTREQGRDPDKLRIIKIVYSNANPDDLKRYRDAGVTEFDMASNGEIPTDEAGLNVKFDEFGETFVRMVAAL